MMTCPKSKLQTFTVQSTSENGTFGLDRYIYFLYKTGQPNEFDNRTNTEIAKIRTFGFRMFTVCTKFGELKFIQIF